MSFYFLMIFNRKTLISQTLLQPATLILQHYNTLQKVSNEFERKIMRLNFHCIPKSVANYIDRRRNCIPTELYQPLHQPHILSLYKKQNFPFLVAAVLKQIGLHWLLISSNILFVNNSTQENSFVLKASKNLLVLEYKIYAVALYTNPLQYILKIVACHSFFTFPNSTLIIILQPCTISLHKILTL